MKIYSVVSVGFVSDRKCVLWHQRARVFARDNKYSGLAVMRRDVVRIVLGAVPSVERAIACSWRAKTDTPFTCTLRYWTRDSEALTLHQIPGSFTVQTAVTEFWMAWPSCTPFACGPNGCLSHYLSLYFGETHILHYSLLSSFPSLLTFLPLLLPFCLYFLPPLFFFFYFIKLK
jgi:hypothetical protein